MKNRPKLQNQFNLCQPFDQAIQTIFIQNLSQGSYILSFDKNQASGLSKKFVVE